MPRGWEGNRRSGVALAMHHRLEWFIHLRAQRPRVGDEHPAYAPAGAWFPLPLPLQDIRHSHKLLLSRLFIIKIIILIKTVVHFLQWRRQQPEEQGDHQNE